MVGPRRKPSQLALEDQNVFENMGRKRPRAKEKPKEEDKKREKSSSLTKKYAYKKNKKPLTSLTSEENIDTNQDQISQECNRQSTSNAGSLLCESNTNTRFTETKPDLFQKQLLEKGLQKHQHHKDIQGYHSPPYCSVNLIHLFQNMSLGIKSRDPLRKVINNPVISVVKELELFRTASPFDRRVTALEWHPTRQNILAVGSKGGDIILWDTENVNKEKLVQGIGAAGSCQALKFWPWDLNKVVSASINGTVTLHDFDRHEGLTLADTMDSHDHWYCSVDLCPSRYLVAAGRNNGILHLMSTEGRKVFEFRLHKNKITHVEFSAREDWLLCTASVDQTVQMWDVRYMKDRKNYLQLLQHEKPVNSAYFNEVDGTRLLTTDQSREIRVYRAPDWRLETTIQHPHRFFQHITPFKATWHPLQDLIICGRYPDTSFPGYTSKELRTIDVLDAETGGIVSQIYNPGTDGLCPLNKFNRQGDALASGMGFHILLWNRKQGIQRKQAMLLDGMKAMLGIDDSISQVHNHGNQSLRSNPGSGGQRSNQNSRSRKRKDDNDTDDLKKKKKTALKTKTETKNKSVKKQ